VKNVSGNRLVTASERIRMILASLVTEPHHSSAGFVNVQTLGQTGHTYIGPPHSVSRY